MKTKCILLLTAFVFLTGTAGLAQATASASNNQKAGGSLLPVPQQSSFTDSRYQVDDSWSVVTGAGVSNSTPALLSLNSGLKDRYGLRLRARQGVRNRTIELVIKAGTVKIGPTTDTNRTALAQQAYKVKLDANKIVITGNAAPGLFYGVQTVLQLLQRDKGLIFFPGGEVVDWPDMDLRMIYWDNAHHIQRFEAMKRAIRQASYYKINAFTVKLEGHFQFKSAKPITEPYAYTAAEYAELTEYARAHHMELVPWIDGPAHVSFILKHPEYKHLRAFPNSNYEFDVLSPEADKLLIGMFDELFEANKGGKYVLFSTDEAYYVGKSPKDKPRADALGGNGKLLADYISRIGNKLHAKGRKAIIWAEFPLTVDDIDAIPSHIISGVYNKDWAAQQKAHGMRQLIYTSTQGVEPHFPLYHKPDTKKVAPVSTTVVLNDDEALQGEIEKGRVGEVLHGITSTIADKKADLMGVIVAAWGDAGLNPETFWLGYAAGAAPAWKSKGVTAENLSQRFYNSFYGDKHVQMHHVYELLSKQANFWDKSWDWDISPWRTPIFGNSYKIFDTAQPAKDQTLPQLPVPSGTNLSLNTNWNSLNKARLDAAEEQWQQSNELMSLLHQNIVKADYQHYNLQVLESVAVLTRQNLKMLLALKKINSLLETAASVASSNPSAAVTILDDVLDHASKIRDERNEMLQTVTTTWYQDWHPRVAEANGRKFVDEVDDVKDHQPVRTVDMSYLIYRQLKYPMGKWAAAVQQARNQFARTHNLPESKYVLDWEKYQ
ncbi:MAG: glycoside hydrolase [Chitinophagaceae bacterium]|nr:MAG: glycoside hydrolase [Chitinophagaceae bacterium]